MPYATGRTFHDADAHIMELPGFLRDNATQSFADRMPLLGVSAIGDDPTGGINWAHQTCPLHNDPNYRANEAELLQRKNYYAVGAFERDHRAQALDQLGFASQLVFNTWTSGFLAAAEQANDADLAYAMADAHNRGMVDFCAPDARLLPVAYVCLMDLTRAAQQASEALALGAKALMIASHCPQWHSPSHVGLDGVWARAEEAGVPIVMHVGGGHRLLSPMYFNNGLPAVPDFHGGAENFRSVDYMAIPFHPMQTMSTLILDGVLDRFPKLQWGIIEQGASWVPGWMRSLDSAFGAFRKNEDRLQRLSAKPSEIVRRQVKVTPYPHEEVGWIVKNSGPEICLFSSDYPHVEGGRNPLKRFAGTTEQCTDEELNRFYETNMVELMGAHIPKAGFV